MTDRDTFAAAALTGLLAQGDDGSFSEESYVRGAYRWADAMLRERAKTNHDAAPAARASVESVAPQPTTRGDSDRTDKAAPRPSEGTGDTPDSPKPISGCVSDRPTPITGPDPDSRVWETPVHTPATHATQGECSKPREGKEPVAWAAIRENGQPLWLSYDRSGAEAMVNGMAEVVPLYRHPPCQDFRKKT